MAATPGVWGIDVGQCALKALRLEMIDGVPTATAFDYIEHPKILSQADANPDDLTREALDKFLARNPIKGDKVAIGVPGQSGLARFVKLPPVEEKKIDDIVKFEAKQQIPFPLEEVVWDFQRIGQGQVSDGFAIDTEIGLFAMKRDMISRFMSHFQQVGIEVHIVQMSPLALCNYVTYDLMPDGASKDERGKKKCIVALDLGTDNSNLIITDADKIIWQRPIPLGGNHFTRALTKEMKLTFAKAEHVKRNAAKSPELPNILKALRPVLTDFVGEVQRSLGYFTNTHRDAAVGYMVGIGSGFKLPGMQKYLAEKLNLDVRKPAKFERMTGESVMTAPAFIENLLSFPVAYGLATQGLKLSRLTTNLLPPEIHRDRQIRSKKPYAVAAAAMVMLGTGVLALGASFPFHQAQAEVIQTAIKDGKAAKDEAGRIMGEINAKQQDVESTTLKVSSVISGQDERKNWLRLYKFIDDALPIPGEKGNLLDSRNNYQTALWQTQYGIEAAQRYKDRLASGLAPTASIEEAYREHLAAVDIEAVNTRYTDNLKGAYDNFEEYMKLYLSRKSKILSENFDGADLAGKDAWKEKPTGAGWLVEIRGSTFYKTPTITSREFLRRAVIWNILRTTQKPKEGTAPKGREIEPILGNISHVFLYNVWEDKLPDPGQWKWIGSSLVDEIVARTGSPAEGGDAASAVPGTVPVSGGEMTPGASASTSMEGPWTALTSTTGASGAAAPGPSAMPGGPGMMPGGPGRGGDGPGGMPGRGPSGGGGPGGGGGGGGGAYAKVDAGDAAAGPGTTTAPADPNQPRKPIKPRYEFVIVFTWKEPVPSDKSIAPPVDSTALPK